VLQAPQKKFLKRLLSRWIGRFNTVRRTAIYYLPLTLVALPSFADVKISNLSDFDFGQYSGSGGLFDRDNICINVIPSSGNNYQVVITGDGSSGEFEISNGVDSLPFSVRYKDATNGEGGRKITPGEILSNQKNASDTLDCSDGLNAKIDVTFQEADLLAAQPGRYTGQLTITISPE